MLKCSYADHGCRDIQGFCMNSRCDKLRPYCLNCLKQFHSKHVRDLIDFKDINDWNQRESDLQKKKIQNAIQNFEQAIQLLNQIIKSINNTLTFDLMYTTTSQLNFHINQILKLKKIDQIEDQWCSNTYLETLRKFCLELQPLESCKISEVQIENKESQELISTMVLKTTNLNNYMFSLNQKHKDITIINCSEIKSQEGFCLCEPQLDPKSYENSIAFKIKEIKQFSNIFIGICFKDQLERHNYDTTLLYEDNHCSYLISSQGDAYSNHRQEFKGQQFKFFQDDIIIVKVDMTKKTVYWINQRINKSFEMNFQEREGLSFVVGFQGAGGKISIN